MATDALVRAEAVLLHAPNVHTGGGLVLLQAVLDAWPAERSLQAWLDVRAQQRLRLPSGARVHWVAPRLASRWQAERSLREAAVAGTRLLCFHGLPPLWRVPAHTAVFLQNRLLIEPSSLEAFSWRTRQRIRVERWLHRRGRASVDAYWVQTPSMAAALREDWGSATPPPVHVLGFAAPAQVPSAAAGARFDFVYVADGEAHKNHRRLLQAWVALAAQGHRPSLALTLSARDAALRDWVAEQVAQHRLAVELLPALSHEEVLGLYRRCGALIFPSLGESYGLPLIEATQAGLPILAGELDFVRDVCVPVQTFDPRSSTSIARAVLRHLGQDRPPTPPATARAFLDAVLSRG